MKRQFVHLLIAALGTVRVGCAADEVVLTNDASRVSQTGEGAVLVSATGTPPRLFRPQFTVLIANRDPKLELRWGDWGDPGERNLYNVLTWFTGPTDRAVRKPVEAEQHVEGSTGPASGEDRTMDVFRAGPVVTVRATDAQGADNRLQWMRCGSR